MEVDDAFAIHSSSAEVHEEMLWDGFISLLDEKEKRVVICLRKGLTQHLEISTELGYAGHSSVTKLLQHIRRKAANHFGIELSTQTKSERE